MKPQHTEFDREIEYVSLSEIHTILEYGRRDGLLIYVVYTHGKHSTDIFLSLSVTAFIFASMSTHDVVF